MAKIPCDIVLEGGGVKGTGLVGALHILLHHGYAPQRVAGTSAGAVIGSLLAAGMPITKLTEHMTAMDYKKFRDPSLLSRLGWPGAGLSLILKRGVYKGDYVRETVYELLAQSGVRTFKDLALEEPWAEKLPPERRYKLVVIASDITHGRLVRLPWDYHLYGLNPDTQLVADAVRASMSIPYFYRPARLGRAVLVDGAMLSNFPIDSFDDTAEWPTLGVKLSSKEKSDVMRPITNPVDFTLAMLSTMMEAHDRMHLDDPEVTARTIFVDTYDVKGTDFGIDNNEKQLLFASGQAAATKFLSRKSLA